MQFETNTQIKNLGEKIGVFVASLFFFSMLYLILTLTHKIPEFIKYWHIFWGVITAHFIWLIGNWLLKKIKI